MSDYVDYEISFDDHNSGLRHECRCGEQMVFVPDDDPKSDDYEWLCPYCDADRIEEQS